ncbi:hypothetical protein GCM10010207_59410 [Streptomyces atratus]|nr:hypothetical protein GCM10010207_59410 [Streptomyces atratus]
MVIRRHTQPFGEMRGTQPAQWTGDKGFVGGTQDPMGLTHLGAREYDPTTGRGREDRPGVGFAQHGRGRGRST